MAEVKERHKSIRVINSVKEEPFFKSSRGHSANQAGKQTQAVHLSQYRHGSLQPGPMKTRPPNVTAENKRHMAVKGAQDWDDEKFLNDSYSAHHTRVEEARRRGSQFQDILIMPQHILELDEKRRWSRSSLFGGCLNAGKRESMPPENSKTGQFSQTRSKSFIDRRKSSVSFRESRRKSSLIKPIAFNRTSIMTQRRGKSLLQIDQEQTNQARRESNMDSMGTCTYVKVRHILSQKQGLMMDVYNQLHRGWLVFGHRVPPKEFGKLAEKYSECRSAKDGGDLGWIARAKVGTAGTFQEVSFTTPVGSCSTVFQSSDGFHILLVEARKN